MGCWHEADELKPIMIPETFIVDGVVTHELLKFKCSCGVIFKLTKDGLVAVKNEI